MRAGCLQGRPPTPPTRRHRRPYGCQPHLGHVDGAGGQRLVAQDGSVLVPLSSLQHDLKLVAFSFQEVGVLRRRGATVTDGHAPRHPRTTCLSLGAPCPLVTAGLSHREQPLVADVCRAVRPLGGACAWWGTCSAGHLPGSPGRRVHPAPWVQAATPAPGPAVAVHAGVLRANVHVSRVTTNNLL